jgi:hypothetical protein
MSTNRNLSAPRNEFDLGRPLATRTGKVIHRLARVHEDRGLAETSCTKFLPAMQPTLVTRTDRKGRWGVLLGGGVVPTCPACLAAHHAAIGAAREESPREIALANISSAPATQAGHDELTRVYGQKDPQTAKVGDLVYGYSRGAYRRGVVIKVTPTKVEMFYTTDGAVKDAQRIFESISSIVPAKSAKFAAESASRNYAHYRKTAAEYQRRVDGGEPYEALRSFEQTDFANIKALLEETREDYIARNATEAFEKATAKLENNKSYRQYVHCTTKAVKKSDIYLV